MAKRASLWLIVASACSTATPPPVETQVAPPPEKPQVTRTSTVPRRAPDGVTQVGELVFERFRLANGSRLIVGHDTWAKAYALEVCFPYGAASDAAGAWGQADVGYALVRQSSATGLSKKARALGAQVQADFHPDWTCLSSMANEPSSVDALLKAHADHLTSFLDADFADARARAVAAVDARQSTSAVDRMEEALLGQVFEASAGTNYGLPSMARKLSINQLSADTTASALAARFNASEAIIIIAGDFDRNSAIDGAEKYFGDGPARTSTTTSARKPAAGGTKVEINLPTKHHYMLLGWSVAPYDHDTLVALEAALQIMRNQTFGPLVTKGVLRSVDAWLTRYRGGAVFQVLVSMKSRRRQKRNLRKLQKAIDGFRLEKDGLVAVRERLRNRRLATLDAPSRRARAFAKAEIADGGMESVRYELSAIQKLTVKQVEDAVKDNLGVKQRIMVVGRPSRRRR